MKKNLKINLLFPAILFLALFGWAGSSQAANYYVDFEGGNDANDGLSSVTAWKHSPGDANATGNADRSLNAGDTVLFRGGVVYRGSVFFF